MTQIAICAGGQPLDTPIHIHLQNGHGIGGRPRINTPAIRNHKVLSQNQVIISKGTQPPYLLLKERCEIFPFISDINRNLLLVFLLQAVKRIQIVFHLGIGHTNPTEPLVNLRHGNVVREAQHADAGFNGCFHISPILAYRMMTSGCMCMIIGC